MNKIELEVTTKAFLNKENIKRKDAIVSLMSLVDNTIEDIYLEEKHYIDLTTRTKVDDDYIKGLKEVIKKGFKEINIEVINIKQV